MTRTGAVSTCCAYAPAAHTPGRHPYYVTALVVDVLARMGMIVHDMHVVSARLKVLLLTVTALVIAMTSSCSTHSPEIQQISFTLVQQKGVGRANVGERLSVFVHAEDADGSDELQQLIIVHDQSEYVWSLHSDQWSSYEDSGYRWIGSSTLQMPGSAFLPRGRYRVTVEDLSGRRDEREFFIPGQQGDVDLDMFPDILESGQDRLIDSVADRSFLVGVTRAGDAVTFYQVRDGLIGSEFRAQALGEERWFLVHKQRPFAYVTGPINAEDLR